ncbi:MAG: TlpA family protein disulfide reductase [Balneolales bacterium]|nr:TlpA family protein disulfide reductase [Balneolales bacterium]
MFFTTVEAEAQTRGSTISDFTLEDLNGDRHSLSEYLEKGPVYISFFAMWCQPCLHKLRILKPVWDQYREEGFTLLVINTDTPNSLSRVEAYWRSQRYDMPLLLDPSSRVFEQLNGRALPYAVMIAQDGTIVQVDTGFLPGDEKKVEEKIQELLSR